MVPLVVLTSPENGASNVDLKSDIVISFANDILDPSSSKISVWNVTKNKSIIPSIIFDEEKPDSITVSFIEDIATSGNKMCGLTTYRVSINGIRDKDFGDKMSKEYSLEFITKAESILDAISNSDNVFQAVASYPENNSQFIDAKSVKVKYNTDIKISDNLKVTVIPDIMDKIDVMDLLEIEPIDGSVSIVNQILKFEPEVLFSKNKTYSIDITGLLSVDDKQVLPYRFQFTTPRFPYYGTENDIVASEYEALTAIVNGNKKYVSDLIYANSIKAQNIATEASTYESIDWENAPTYIYEYVVAKTKYDIINSEYLRITTGANKKVLADLEISYTYTISDLYKILAILKKEYEEKEAQIKGITLASAQTALFQKGSAKDASYDFMNRALKDLTGAKTW